MNAKMIMTGLATVLSLAGCRKDLCYNHAEHALAVRVDVEATWEREWEQAGATAWEEAWNAAWGVTYEGLRPEVATGIRAVVYRADGGMSEYNLGSDGGLLPMMEGRNSLLFYNNDTEYIVFDNVDESAMATASTRSRSRANFEDLREGERTVNAPDMLYGAYVRDYEAVPGFDTVALPVVMRPLVYTYLVCYEFSHGLKYVALARGALAGMAESVYLNDGHTGGATATVLYDDCEILDWGVAALVRSFGAPNHPNEDYSRAPAGTYMLNLEVRLTNGEFKSFDFDVTDQVEAQPRGGVIVVRDIEVTDDEGSGIGGGFDVSVDGWGEYVDIELPLN